MPKYWGKQIFTHGRFPEVGQKQKTAKRENTTGTRGLIQAPQPNAGCKKQKNTQKSAFVKKIY